MDELLGLAAKVSTVGFPTLLVLVLLGNYYDVWVWGKRLREEMARCERERTEEVARHVALLQASENREREWKELAQGFMNVGRTAVNELASRPR